MFTRIRKVAVPVEAAATMKTTAAMTTRSDDFQINLIPSSLFRQSTQCQEYQEVGKLPEACGPAIR
jgi:hypothetical protein